VQISGWTFLALAVTALAGAARAEVVAEARNGFVVAHQMRLEATPELAYQALVDVGAWWDVAHSYSGVAGNLTLDARAGGCFCERLADGGSVEHLRVVAAFPGKMLRMVGGLGPLQGMGATGAMEFAFSADGAGTRLDFRYTVSGFAPDGLGAVAEPVDAVLKGQLARLAAHLAAADQHAR